MSAPSFDPLAVLRALIRHEVRFVLIGGFAAAIRGSPVISGDVDICYARDDDNLERLADALNELVATLRGAPTDVPFRLDAQALKAGNHFTFATAGGPLDCLGNSSRDRRVRRSRRVGHGRGPRWPRRPGGLRRRPHPDRAAGRPQDLIAVEWLAALRDELET